MRVGYFQLKPGFSREGNYKTHHVCTCVNGCMWGCISCHTDFSATDFLSIVLMNFHALVNCVGFVDLGLKISK